MVIFPAIDIRGGKCVRLTQGDYGRETVYGDDPVAQACAFVEQGATWLHVVDLDGARVGEPVNHQVIGRIAQAVTVPVQVGGGVRSLLAARRLLDSGAARVIVGTRLVHDRSLAETLFRELGDQVVAGIDGRRGRVAVSGWEEGTDLDVVAFAREMQDLGARRVIFTEIEVDGSLTGVALEATHRLAQALTIPVIASGGVGSLVDIAAVAELEPVGVEGVIVGKALYDARFSLSQALAVISGIAS